MWVRISSWFAVVLLNVAACSDTGAGVAPTGRLPIEVLLPAPTAPAEPAPQPPKSAPDDSPSRGPRGARFVVGFTGAGEVAVVEIASGDVVATSAGGEGRPVDVAVDVARARVVTVETDEDDGGGEVSVYSLGAAGELGRREHLVSVDGRMRLSPVDAGLVAFEEGYGERWKLLAEAITPSIAAGRPTSAWVQRGAAASVVNALVLSERDAVTRLEWLAADVSPAGISQPVVLAAIDEPWVDRDDARLVPRGAGESPILVERTADELVVRVATTSGFGPALVVAVGFEGRIDGAVALAPALVAVALSAPARVGFVSLADPARPAWSQVSLPSEPIPSDRLPERNLACIGAHRVLVATAAGVIAVSFVNEVATLDAPFANGALYGPMATIE